MSHTRSTNAGHGGARTRPSVIDEIHDQWCRDNGYSGKPQAPSTEPQASSKASSTDSQEARKLQVASITQSHKLSHRGPLKKFQRPLTEGSDKDESICRMCNME